jgi:hypothetical protein
MIFTPLFVVLCVRPRADTPSAHAPMRRLVIATLVCGLLLACAWAAVPQLARFGWLLFFPLFFGFAMPAIMGRRPEWMGDPMRDQASRSALLVNRARVTAVPPWAWFAASLLVAAALTAIAMRLGSPSLDAAARNRVILALAVEGVVGGTMLVLLAFVVPMVRNEPEPLRADGADEIAAAYARLRRFKMNAFVWLFAVGINATLGAILVAIAWLPPDRAALLGIFGGIAGSVIGIGGALVGVRAAAHRARINALLTTPQ